MRAATISDDKEVAWEFINEFIDALISGCKPSYTGEDGKRDVQTTMAAICSAKEGLPVRVEEVTDLRFAKIPEATA